MRLYLDTADLETIRRLTEWGAFAGVVRREWEPGERRKLYLAEVDVWRVVSRMLRGRELVEVDAAVDSMERALEILRGDLTKSSGEDRETLVRKIRRVEGLLDLMRIVASVLRLLITTGRLDASVLAGLRLGQEPGEDE